MFSCPWIALNRCFRFPLLVFLFNNCSLGLFDMHYGFVVSWIDLFYNCSLGLFDMHYGFVVSWIDLFYNCSLGLFRMYYDFVHGLSGFSI